MGSMQAQATRDLIDEAFISERTGLALHLTSNIFPPVPSPYLSEMLDTVEAALKAVREHQGEREVELPEGVTSQRYDGRLVPASWVIEQFCLWDLV